MFNLIASGKKSEQPLAKLRDEFEALIDGMLSRWPAPFDTQYGIDRLWGLDVEDRDNEIIVRTEVPGFEPDELDVQVRNGLLIVKAEKRPKGENAANCPPGKCESRSHLRKVKVPDKVNVDG